MGFVLVVAGLFGANFDFAGGSGADDATLEATVLGAGFLRTDFLAGFLAALAALAATAGFTRRAGAAFFAAGLVAGAGRLAVLIVRFFARAVFFASTVLRARFAGFGFACAGFVFTAVFDGAMSDFCSAAFWIRFASFLASLAALSAAFLARFASCFASLAARFSARRAAFSAFFASFLSAFDFFAMLGLLFHRHQVTS